MNPLQPRLKIGSGTFRPVVLLASAVMLMMLAVSCQISDEQSDSSDEAIAATVAAAVPATQTAEAELEDRVADAVSATLSSRSDDGTAVPEPTLDLDVTGTPASDVISAADTEEYALVAVWGSFGDDIGEFDEPHALAVDADGNVFVAERLGFRIQKFNPDSDVLALWESDLRGDALSVVTAEDIETMPDGVLVGLGSEVFEFFDGDGQYETPTDAPLWCKFEQEPYPIFDSSDGIATDSAGNVYVADSCTTQVMKFTREGRLILSWTIGEGEWSRFTPCDLDVDSQGTVYVVDCLSGEITGYTPDGELLGTFASLPTTAPEAVRARYRLAIGPRDQLIVLDCFEGELLVFGKQGDIIESWPIIVPGFSVSPEDLAVHKYGSVYIAVTNGAYYRDEFGQSIERPDHERGDFVLVYRKTEAGDSESTALATVGPQPTP